MTKLDLRCQDVQEGLPSEFVNAADVSVFSPPYFSRDGYSDELMRATGRAVADAIGDGGRAFMVFGQSREEPLRPFRAVQELIAGSHERLWLVQTIVWVKSIAIDGKQRAHYKPINSANVLNYCHEYVFMFAHGGDCTPLDRLAIGVPFASKSNLKRGTRGKNGDMHCAGDTWFVPYRTTGQTKKKCHRHGFPLELATRCLLVAGMKPSQTVFDPFMGGGTTAVAAKLLGMNAFGFELNQQHCDAARVRWAEACEPAATSAPVTETIGNVTQPVEERNV